MFTTSTVTDAIEFVSVSPDSQETPQMVRAAEERLLLTRLGDGDLAAFWQLWEAYQGYLYARCLQWMGGDVVEAEDALSNVMLKVYERLPSYACEISNLRAWLIRVTHNLCVDMQRSRARQPIGLEHLDAVHVSRQETVGHVPEAPEHAILWREIRGCLRHSFNDLPPHLREPLRLRVILEMPYQDIAKQLTLTNDNARKRVQQARHLLRQRFRRHVYGRKPMKTHLRGSLK
jgi:RNA polymerase sigma-70 factor (ECF subfamily)